MKIKVFLSFALECFFLFLVNSLFIVNKKTYKKFVERLCYRANQSEYLTDILTLSCRPKDIQKIETSNTLYKNLNYKNAILIQGQIIEKNNFTLKTVKLYKKIFRNTPLIVSTWNDTPTKVIEEFKRQDIHLILNTKPKCSGFLNFNYQLRTTLNGLKYIENLNGVNKVLKTRSDQRIYSPFALNYMNNLDKLFPTKNNKVNSRILLINNTSLVNFPFHICDMLQFGNTKDLLFFWDIKPHKNSFDKNFFNNKIRNKATPKDILKWTDTIPEVHIGRNIANRIYGRIPATQTYHYYYKLIREVFCIIDHQQIELFWPKYDSIEFLNDSYTAPLYEKFSFSKWLYITENEEIKLNYSIFSETV